MVRGRAAVSTVRRRKASANRRFPLSPTFVRRLSGFALLAIAVLSSISLAVTENSSLASNWNSFLRGNLGWGAFLTPILFGVFGLALVWPSVQQNYRFQRREAVGWILLFTFFVTLFQLVVPDSRQQVAAFGGGSLGQLFARGLTGLMGPTGATTLTVLALIFGGVLAFGIGPRELWGLVLLGFVVTVWLVRLLWRLLRALVSLSVSLARPLRSRTAPEAGPHFRINRPEIDQSFVADVHNVRKDRSSEQPMTHEPLQDAKQSAVPRVAATGVAPAVVGRGDVRQWQVAPLALLEPGGDGELSEDDIQQKVQRIEDTLRDFGIAAKVAEVNPGPVVTQFGLDPGYRERRDRYGNVIRRDKVKVSEITALRDDLALALAARTIRIEAPVPGRAVIGLEIPNSTATVVRLRKVIETNAFQRVRLKTKLAFALGQDVSGGAVAGDLAKMPHLLIAGATGSGKSVCMNSIITSFLLHTTPDELRMVMIDPKRVELTTFREVPHLLRSVVVDVEHAVSVLKWVMHEMETRLKRFEAQGVRNIDGYNRTMGPINGKQAMPYIVVLIDELADLMMRAADEVERSICRLAQLARATGIHLVIATQRPSVDVVTGLIKANFPTRISFAVASQIDSRTILDTAGAEQLLGSGDMLYMPADAAKPRRLQGVYVSDDEVKRVVDFWRSQGPPQYLADLEKAAAWSPEADSEDPMYERALEVARHHTRVSASLLQRRLGVGYNRAARLIDILEERGVVGGVEGGKPREVLIPASEDETIGGISSGGDGRG